MTYDTPQQEPLKISEGSDSGPAIAGLLNELGPDAFTQMLGSIADHLVLGSPKNAAQMLRNDLELALRSVVEADHSRRAAPNVGDAGHDHTGKCPGSRVTAHGVQISESVTGLGVRECASADPESSTKSLGPARKVQRRKKRRPLIAKDDAHSTRTAGKQLTTETTDQLLSLRITTVTGVIYDEHIDPDVAVRSEMIQYVGSLAGSPCIWVEPTQGRRVALPMSSVLSIAESPRT